MLGTYVDLGSVDNMKRQSAVNDFISQIPVCKALQAPCMGSETSSMVQPGATHADAKYAAAFYAMKGLTQEVIPVLREEAVPRLAKKDQAFMRRIIER